MKLDIGLGSKFMLIGAGLVVSALSFKAAPPAADGATIFKKNCVMCHGAEGKGFPALKTPDFTDPKWQSPGIEKEMKEVVKNGKKGTPMKAFGDKLSDEEISAVVAYIRTLGKK